MLFKPYHIEWIQFGWKTATRRFWKRWHVKIGGTYPAQTRMYQPRSECPIILVNKRYIQKLKYMTGRDAFKEGYNSLEAFKRAFQEISKKPWDPEQAVYVVEFEYVEG